MRCVTSRGRSAWKTHVDLGLHGVVQLRRRRVAPADVAGNNATRQQALRRRHASRGRQDRLSKGRLRETTQRHVLATGTVVDAERSACRPPPPSNTLTQKGTPAPPVQPLENRRAPESPPPPAIRPRAASPRHENAHSSRERAEWAGAHHLRQGLTAASGGKCSALPMDLNTVPDYKHGRPVVDQSSASR